MRLVTQVYGHSLREVLGLNDDLPLARGVSGIPGTDEPKLRVANLFLLERVGLPTPRARLGTIRRSAKKHSIIPCSVYGHLILTFSTHFD